MPSPDEFESSDPDILAARGKVELAKAELESRLYQVGDSGKRALVRMAHKAKPAAVVAAVALGVFVVVRLVRARARRRASWHFPKETKERPSLFGVALGAAIRGAVRVVATRMAEQAVARLVASDEERELSEHDVDIRELGNEESGASA